MQKNEKIKVESSKNIICFYQSQGKANFIVKFVWSSRVKKTIISYQHLGSSSDLFFKKIEHHNDNKMCPETHVQGNYLKLLKIF